LGLDRIAAVRAGAARRAVAEADRCPAAADVRLLDDRGRQLDRRRADSRLDQRGFPGLAAYRGCRSRFCTHWLITFGLANITPPQAAAIGATIQISRWLGSEIGSAVEAAIEARGRLGPELLEYGNPLIGHRAARIEGWAVQRLEFFLQPA